jgi:5-formyltetrahydrofolate cyclo-ligase
MGGASISERKRELRAAISSQRSLLSRVDSFSCSRVIQASALQFPPYLICRSVALYSPIQNEVETADIRYHALGAGKSVFLPRYGQQDSVDLVGIESPAELSLGPLGIPEPTGQKRLSNPGSGELVVFVPVVAVDLRGRRLGRGKAWYDRLIKELNGTAIFVALAYEFQIVEEVPTDEWDQRVDCVITERRIVDCRCMAVQWNEVS